MRLPISANLVVYNEAHRIRDTLAELRPHVDEIVLVDQSSPDNTGGVAYFDGNVNVLLLDKHHGRCEPSRGLAAQHSKHDWVLVIDADERLESETWEYIRDIVEEDRADVVYFTIANYVGGRHVQNDLMACPRLVKRSKVEFVSHLHGIITPHLHARTLALTEFVAVIHEKTVAEQQSDWDRYSQLEGRDRGTWTDQSNFY